MNSNEEFHLSKWYLDCVTRTGSVFIGYSARFRWRVADVHFAQAFEYRDGRGGQSKTSWGKHQEPELSRDALVWAPQRLHVSGRWQGLSQAVRETLLTTDQGTVQWCCHMPRADAQVLIRDREEISGLGYVEHLRLTVKPWELPINELRWGRYLSDHDTVVWIDWIGPDLRRWVFHNGTPVSCTSLSDDEVVLTDRGLCLRLLDKTVIREGNLLPTLSRIPWADKVIPARILNMYECKWRSRGVLQENGIPVSGGWAIHEVVRWG